VLRLSLEDLKCIVKPCRLESKSALMESKPALSHGDPLELKSASLMEIHSISIKNQIHSVDTKNELAFFQSRSYFQECMTYTLSFRMSKIRLNDHTDIDYGIHDSTLSDYVPCVLHCHCVSQYAQTRSSSSNLKFQSAILFSRIE